MSSNDNSAVALLEALAVIRQQLVAKTSEVTADPSVSRATHNIAIINVPSEAHPVTTGLRVGISILISVAAVLDDEDMLTWATTANRAADGSWVIERELSISKGGSELVSSEFTDIVCEDMSSFAHRLPSLSAEVLALPVTR